MDSIIVRVIIYIIKLIYNFRRIQYNFLKNYKNIALSLPLPQFILINEYALILLAYMIVDWLIFFNV